MILIPAEKQQIACTCPVMSSIYRNIHSAFRDQKDLMTVVIMVGTIVDIPGIINLLYRSVHETTSQ
jgi:hypothetical protein